MSGTINSLGLGSGVLTSDLLDKLKAADTAGIVTPIDNKITLNAQKGQALDLLSSLLTSFKSSVSALDDDTLYQNRTVSGNNDGVSVTAAAGSQIRDFSLDITTIAKKNVLQSGAFTSSTDKIASADGKLNVNIGGKNYTINYTAATTLNDIKQSINDNAGSAVSASVLQTSASSYSLVVTSKTTGKEQAMSLTDLSGKLKNGNLMTGITTGAISAADEFISAVGSSGGNMTVNINGVGHNFAYSPTTTLQDMVNNINNDTTINTKLSASVVQYGTKDYRMVLTPKDAFKGQAIILSDTPATGIGLISAMSATTTQASSMKVVQEGQDASFKFDGISMTRSTNTITDIATGLTLNLMKDATTANITITQNRDKIATEMGSMVSSYNTLIKQLDDMTAYNAAEGKVGIFNGDNTIKNISREVTKIITSFSNSGHSLPNYGINLDKTGVMSFNQAAFTDKMNKDPDGTEGFFSSKTTISTSGVETYTKGVFTSLNDLLSGYTSSTGLLHNLTDSSKSATIALNTERSKASKLLDARYATMQAKFAAYDSMISKLNSQFSSLKQQIDAQSKASG